MRPRARDVVSAWLDAAARELQGQYSEPYRTRAQARSVFFVLLGTAALVLKRHYSGPYSEVVQSYGGNIAASFAVYFVVGLLPLPARYRKLATAVLALAVVELFEAFDGFGVMTNTYDPVDFAANIAGVALALAVDVMTSGLSRSPARRDEQTGL